MALSPQQRKMLMIGVPLVGLVALVAVLKSRSSSAASTTPQSVGAGTGLDAGQLASFENAVMAQLAGFGSMLGAIPGAPQTPAPAPAGSGTTTLSPAANTSFQTSLRSGVRAISSYTPPTASPTTTSGWMFV